MTANHAIRLVATLLLLLFASASRAEDRTSIVETSLRWHVNPFQEGGYTWPQTGGYNTSLFKGRTAIVLDRHTACERMDRTFEKLGFKMKREVAYGREGVEFVVTGYDAEKKLGYLWATTETLGEGFFDFHETSDQEKAARLSQAEAKILDDRAPVTREFIAIVIPYTVRLGYSTFVYRTDEEKADFEKLGAETLEVRLAALDKAVGDYVQWVGALRAEDYPAPSPEPRNLLTFARWSICRARGLPFGACPVGEHFPNPPSDELVKKSIETCGAAAKLDLTAPYTYEKNGASLKLTGFDPKRKIGYLWDYPNEAKRVNIGNNSEPANDAKHFKEVEALATQAEADGLRIAWLSPADARFDNGGAPTLTIDSPPYAAKHEAILKIANRAERAEELRKLDEEIARENQPAIYRLERRMKEFVEWTEKP